MNKRQKGNRNLKKAIDFYKAKGYYVEKLEVLKMGWVAGKIIPIRTDILGADLYLIKRDEFILCQVKSNKNDIRRGILQFEKYPFPDFIKRQIILFEPRQKEPIIKIIQ